MQLNLLTDFDLFVLQFYFIKLEMHPDVNVPGLFALSPMQHAHEAWCRQACSPDVHYQKTYESCIL